MYAVVRNYTGVEGFADALMERESEVQQLLRDIAGFRAYYCIRSGPADVVTVSVYDDQAGADASVTAAREWIAATLPNLGVGAPRVAGGEVVITA
jgi:heme-degrading monooxygenase HmoA